MRKLISVVMATLILFTMPLNAFAAEDHSTYTHEELIQLGCDVFPEYADKILHSNCNGSSISTFSNRKELLFEETRKVSEDVVLTYTEYSNNMVFLTSATYYSNKIDHTMEWVSGTLYRYNVGLQATSNSSSDVFLASNITFQESNETHATITSRGELSDSSTSDNEFSSWRQNETNSLSAYTSYNATFHLNDGSNETVTVTLYRKDHTTTTSVKVAS